MTDELESNAKTKILLDDLRTLKDKNGKMAFQMREMEKNSLSQQEHMISLNNQVKELKEKLIQKDKVLKNRHNSLIDGSFINDQSPPRQSLMNEIYNFNQSLDTTNSGGGEMTQRIGHLESQTKLLTKRS